MLTVGLTGNVASGKSSVARVWRELGTPVVDADELARRAVEPGRPALRAIVERWGPGVLDAQGGLDRAALRELVFRDPEARAQLEALVHPEVAALREQEFRRAAERGEPLLVADIPLLFEVGLQDDFDVVVLVDAPAELRLARMVRDRGLAPEEALRIIEAQMPAELKRDQAHLVIDNVGSREQLEARAREVWAELKERAARGEAR